MANNGGSVERLAVGLGRAVATFSYKLDDETTLDTLARMGVEFPTALLTDDVITPARRTVLGAARTLTASVDALRAALAGGNLPVVVAAGVAVLEDVVSTLDSAVTLGATLQQQAQALGVDAARVATLVAGLPRKLLDRAVVDAVDDFSPPLGALLTLVGVFERIHHPADPTGPEFEEVRVRFDRIIDFFGDPAGHLHDLYGWGNPVDGAKVLALDGAQLLTALRDAMALVGLPALLAQPGGVPELRSGHFTIAQADDGLRVTMTDTLSEDTGETPVIIPGKDAGWSATIAARWTIPEGTAVEIHPPLDVRATPPSGAFDGAVRAKLTGSPDEPILLLGEAGGSRLEIAEIAVTGGLTFELDPGTGQPTATPELTGELRGGRLVIDAAAADGFIATLLGGGRVDAEFEVGFAYAVDTGLRFHGSGGLEITVPVHLELGPLEIQQIHLAATLAGGTIPVELSTSFAAQLGPVRASIERLGLITELSFPDGGGNLGPLDLSFAFKAPTGVGLAIDAGVVAGGGYLSFDPDRGEYAGALELDFADIVELKAIGLISTRMPDGTKGFSLLIVITAEFGGGGIQLGYGFTLLAVGGIVGLNRAMNLQALVEGVRSGSIESVMFPKDVIANAPRILSDLKAFFPPEQGKFLIGPMAKIGWGTPALVTVSLGVIIEIPGDIAVIGVLKCVLPNDQLPLLVLQVNFIGAVEFDKQRVWFFAQLFESRILTMTIDGGMGLLVGWGDNPDLVLTVGGFHPSFQPPPLPFPVPDRIAVDVLNQPLGKIRVSGYFAVTSNTVQFGAKAELRLGLDDFGIEGHLEFDALFQLSPFEFIVNIGAGVSLKVFGIGLFGIDLQLRLSGPTPWNARGTGSISLLFFEISADFDITWGESRETGLPAVDVLPLLAAEIGKVEGWETRLPTGGGNALVTLRKLPETDKLVLHPLGSLFVRQRALPLDVHIDRIGAQETRDGTRFTVEPEQDSGLVLVSTTADRFAMAQFQNMDEAAKLSRAAYENQDAGLELAAAGGPLTSARVVRRSARYELIVIDSKAREAQQGTTAATALAAQATKSRKRLTSVSPAVFDQLLTGSSTSRSALSQQEARQRQPFTDTVRVPGRRFAVAYVRNNQRVPAPRGAGGFRSQTLALDTLRELMTRDPALAGRLHVVPDVEARGAVPTPHTWSPTGAAPFAATGAAAVALHGGRVLLAGGTDATGQPVATAALYDPVTGVWTAAPPLATARHRHSATLLGDGRVLVAGGLGATGTALSTAEVYDPATGQWSAAAGMTGARAGHTATWLVNGRLLVAGGSGGTTTLSSAELFDPALGTWAPAAPMTDARAGHAVAVLPGGVVLVAGGTLAHGDGRETPLAYCERYDPVDDAWTPAGSLRTPRAGHQATTLAGGGVLVTGGNPVTSARAGRIRLGSLDSAERYDPDADEWLPVRRMPGGICRHRAVRLPNGDVLVIGGTGGPAFAAGHRGAAVYHPTANTWTNAGGLAVGRWGHAVAALPDGRVLVVGGAERSGPATATPGTDVLTATAEVFAP